MASSISSQDFISRFNSPGEIVEVYDLIISGKTQFNSSNFLCDGAVLTNCKFSELSFVDLTIEKGIRLQLCNAAVFNFRNLNVLSDSEKTNSYNDFVTINKTEISTLF